MARGPVKLIILCSYNVENTTFLRSTLKRRSWGSCVTSTSSRLSQRIFRQGYILTTSIQIGIQRFHKSQSVSNINENHNPDQFSKSQYEMLKFIIKAKVNYFLLVLLTTYISLPNFQIIKVNWNIISNGPVIN